MSQIRETSPAGHRYRGRGATPHRPGVHQLAGGAAHLGGHHDRGEVQDAVQANQQKFLSYLVDADVLRALEDAATGDGTQSVTVAGGDVEVETGMGIAAEGPSGQVSTFGTAGDWSCWYNVKQKIFGVTIARLNFKQTRAAARSPGSTARQPRTRTTTSAWTSATNPRNSGSRVLATRSPTSPGTVPSSTEASA